MIKVLNLYAGIGGNRKLWENVDVTAVEIDPEIAKIYKAFFPEDKVIIKDAHKYLIKNYDKFDFIWSSPPCPTHSKIRFMASLAPTIKERNRNQLEKKYPNMDLYQEIIFLTHYCKKKWVVENVIGYYDPLIKPFESGKHYFWSNFHISNYKIKNRGHHLNINDKQKKLGFNLDNFKIKNYGRRKDQILRNCVEPELGRHIFNCAFKEKQEVLM